ncbi:MAG: polysaccharide deacetylase [Anaerolineaceae bacterium]|nr:MAG: polysaccharide deacetylase [Anaerolineaceae bacterium]
MKQVLIAIIGGLILISGSCSSAPKKKVVKPVKPKPVNVETKIEHDKIAGLFVFPGGKLKALVMSFDDGPDQDKRLIEIFNKYGIKGTFHLNSGKFAAKSKASLDQLKTVYKGHEVSAHSVSHPHLEFLPASKVSNEILADREKLEKVFGYPIHGMSYPFGTYNQLVLDLLPSLGIVYSRTVTIDASFRLPKNLLVWNPTCHSGTGEYWAKKFIETKKDEMMLLFIWGHAWEFDNAATDSAKEKKLDGDRKYLRAPR